MEETNFKVVQGDTFVIQVTYEDPNGDPIDLTSFSARMDVRNEPGGKILCASITNDNGISIDGSNGILTITLSPSQTRRLTTPSAAYQLQIISTSDIYTTILKGYFSVYPAVVR